LLLPQLLTKILLPALRGDSSQGEGKHRDGE